MLTSARILRQTAAAAPAKRMVCKFGGTSMATADSLAHVHQILEEKGRVGVVVSAPGKRFKGDTKTTDLLIQLHKLFVSAGVEQAVSGGNAGRSFISSASKEEQVRLQEELALQIEERFSVVRKSSASIAEQLLKASDRLEYDFMVSRGEFYCGRAMADALGYDFLDPAEVVFLRPEDGGVDYPYTMDAIRANLSSVENNNKGVVLPGFFGTDRGTKKVRALPRGGSDITGALLADAMAADEYENWTDVDGVFTADPNLIPSALKIDQLSHSELFTLGKNGAQVLHPGTVKACGPNFEIPIHLRNTFNTRVDGTKILPTRQERTSSGNGGPDPRVLGLVSTASSSSISTNHENGEGSKFDVVVVGYPVADGSASVSASKARDAVKEELHAVVPNATGNLKIEEASDPWFKIVGIPEEDRAHVASEIHGRLARKGMFDKI